MLLLALGLMLLNAQHRQLDNALLLAADQQRYLQAYNQAASALSWGISQRWPRAELSAAAWLCRQRAELTACARLSARAGVVTVRGLGEMRGGEPLWLYQWGTFNGAEGAGKVQAQPGGRLDFAPRKGWPTVTANARTGRLSRNGFSLPEVLVAALLFSVSLLGLLQYHQVLLQSFQRQWHYRQARGWRISSWRRLPSPDGSRLNRCRKGGDARRRLTMRRVIAAD